MPDRLIDLKRPRQEKDAIDPGSARDVHVMDRVVSLIQVRGPVRKRGLHSRSIHYTECQIDVGPSVFAARSGRPGDRGASYVLIGGCTLKQLRSDGGALGWCKCQRRMKIPHFAG